MKTPKLLISVLLMLSTTTALAQGRPAHYNRGDFSSFMREIHIWENLDEQAREERERTAIHPDAEYVPDGWVADFDYQSSLQQYLAERVRQASQAGKDLRLYLYADWLESCRQFRKTTASRQDYVELFEGHEIVMLDYRYFAKTFDVEFKSLPVLIQVHEETGIIGPEVVHPLPNRVEHPAKALQRLRDFFSDAG